MGTKMASGQSQLDNSSILVSVRLLPTFAGVLREKKFVRALVSLKS